MYETGTALQVRAFHVMPGMPPPEGERHAHDYRLDVVVRRDDLDVLDAALKGIDDIVRDKNLDIIRPADAEAVTVEVFAWWLHRELAGALGPLPGVTLAVRVWESASAFGGYTAPL